MRINKIQVKPFNFMNFTSIEIWKSVNEHGSALVSGVVSVSDAEQYMKTFQPKQSVTIYATGQEGEDEIMFSGMLMDLNIANRGDTHILTISLISHTFSMDIKKNIRTFQNPNTTYRDITSIITGDSGIGEIIHPEFGGNTLNHLFVQYMETDWRCINRLASRLNAVVVPNFSLDSPFISIGMPKISSVSNIHFEEFSVGIDNELSMISKLYNVKIDAKYYTSTSREMLELCTSVKIMGEEAYVYSISSTLIGEELCHNYNLRSREGFKQKEIFNSELIGVSLTGNIIEVQKDMVRLNIQNDVDQSENKWFSYATVLTTC